MGRSRGVGRDWGTAVLGIALVYTGAFAVWQVAGRGDAHTTMVVADAAALPLSLAAVVLAWRVTATREIDARTRRSWAFLGAAFALSLAGDVTWFLYEVVWKRSPFPSPADAPYLLFYLALLAGLLIYPGASRSPGERRKLALDVGTVLVAATMGVWYLVLGPTVEAGGNSPLIAGLSIAYPVGDLVLMFGIAAVITRGTRASGRRSLHLLLIGVSCYAVADVAFGYLSLHSQYHSGDWPDTLFAIATLGVVASAWQQRRDALVRGEGPNEATTSSRAVLLPYVAIVIVWAMLLFAARNEALFPLLGLLVGGLVLTLLVFSRQVLAVRENAHLVELYQELAGTDSLTGLPNRRRFFEYASREIATARRMDEPTSALMIDLDRFKQINDRFGHAAGDDALQLVANALRSVTRECDLVARYGGDEFVALLPRCDAAAAAEAAARLRSEIARLDEHIRLSVSVGVATLTRADLDELLRQADAALYDAKRSGRDTARTFVLTEP